MLLFILLAWICFLVPLAFYLRHSFNKSDRMLKEARSRQSELGPDFLMVESEDDVWFERKVETGGRNFSILISVNMEIAERSLPYARELADHAEEFLTSLDTFLEESSHHNSLLRKDLPGLKVSEVWFCSRDPAAAEISFGESANRYWWACAYKQGRFYNLNEE